MLTSSATAEVALVFGGSGAVGHAVVRALTSAGLRVYFTYHRSTERAAALAAECGGSVAVQLDLRLPEDIGALFERLSAEGVLPRLFVHCAAVSQPLKLNEITAGHWDEVIAVCCRSVLLACQQLSSRFAQRGGGEVVLIGALDRGQSLPLPVHFAGAQGMLGSMTMALAKELGPLGVRVNLVAVGPLTTGLSQQLPVQALQDFKSFSALRRLGTAEEVARAVVWLGQHNTFMTGRVLPVNGGI